MSTTTTAGATEHWCPRRVEAPHQSPGPDIWESRGSLAGGIAPCCSYCGSLNPDVFMAKVREGWIVEPSDKVYKCYVDEPFSAEEIARIRTNSVEWKAAKRLKLAEGLTEAEATAAADSYWDEHEAQWHRGRTVAKFSFQHLSQAQRDEFLELYNSGAMRIAYPGYFYARPFFAQPAELAAGDD